MAKEVSGLDEIPTKLEETEENSTNSMELVVSDFKKLDKITFNYEELKKELTERVNKYKDIVYTEDTITDAKSDRSLLNKVSKAIDDEKKRVKKKLLEPYTDFESKCKELMSIVDEVSSKIDKQVKAYEESEKDNKMQDVLKYWSENAGDYAKVIDTDKLVKQEWLNKTYSMTKVKQEIDHIISKIKMDMTTIDAAIVEENINKQSKVFYFDNINNPCNLSLAIQEGTRLKEQSTKIDIVERKEKVSEIPQSINEEILKMDFRVWGTKTQLRDLNNYLKENNIKVGKVV